MANDDRRETSQTSNHARESMASGAMLQARHRDPSRARGFASGLPAPSHMINERPGCDRARHCARLSSAGARVQHQADESRMRAWVWSSPILIEDANADSDYRCSIRRGSAVSRTQPKSSPKDEHARASPRVVRPRSTPPSASYSTRSL